MARLTTVVLDLFAVQHNLSVVRRTAPGRRIMAVIKANAYGHGLVETAGALNEADAFAVACMEEALCLRAAGIQKNIILLEGFFEPGELPCLAGHRLQSVVHCFEQISQLQKARLHRPLKVWLKIDTGMNRLGFKPDQVISAWRKLNDCEGVAKPVNFMTHLACADDRRNVMTLRQIEAFERTIIGLAGGRSIANSAGILAWPQSHADWVRPGIMLYGVSPFANRTGHAENLRPVMEFTSVLMRVNRCKQGETLGYGATWRCPEDMPVGVVAAGYGDGYPRHAANGTPVLINGKFVPLVGRVSMDMLTVDLRTLPQVSPGTPVTLWGRDLPVETVATHAGTIAYDLLTAMTAIRVKRVISKGALSPGLFDFCLSPGHKEKVKFSENNSEISNYR